MNRQAANYYESVGDSMPRPWQTTRHNVIWLIITLFLFLFLLFLFWFFNRTSLEEATISLTEQKEKNRIIGSTIYLTYSQAGDFYFSENGNVTYTMFTNNRFVRFFMPARCQLFTINYFDQDKIVKEDTLVSLNLKGYSLVAEANKDSTKRLSSEKKYLQYSDMLFYAKIKSSLINPYIPHKNYSDKRLLPDLYRYEERDIRYTEDTLTLRQNIHLYATKLVTYDDSELDNLKKYFREHPEKKQLQGQEVYSFLPLLKQTFVFADSKRYSHQLDIWKWKRNLRFTNRTCCNLYIKSVEFPCDSNCRFILSFASPMYFDKLSITPDEERANEIIYSSPEKIEELKNSGLYVYARDVSANNQEMLNFLFATILGVLMSYVIEFSKRLYTRHKDKQLQMKN